MAEQNTPPTGDKNKAEDLKLRVPAIVGFIVAVLTTVYTCQILARPDLAEDLCIAVVAGASIVFFFASFVMLRHLNRKAAHGALMAIAILSALGFAFSLIFSAVCYQFLNYGPS